MTRMTEQPTMTIPTRFRGVCEFCNQELDTRTEGTHQWTAGWVMLRSSGGGHGISLAEREQRYAHRYCVERRSRGHTRQGSML